MNDGHDHCHFIGIGGIGMSGLAQILLDRDVRVTGSDLSTGKTVQQLVHGGAAVQQGHHPDHVNTASAVVYSSAVSATNPELQAAKAKKCALLHRSDLLAELMKGYSPLVVAGTHGKTTTSSLLAHVLIHAGSDPSYAIGGILAGYETNARHGQSEWFVAEADESDGSFIKYFPYASIVTNIEAEHMEYYQTEERLIDTFRQFFQQQDHPEYTFWCGDDPLLQEVAPEGVSYGFSEQCALRITNFRQDGWTSYFDITHGDEQFLAVESALIGQHNALNAAAVFALAIAIGIDEDAVREGLRTFQGIARRCEKKGERGQILVIDDYAHHPTEVAAALASIRAAEPHRRLIAVYQPHRYTRTQECIGKYGQMFNEADYVIVTDIHAAGEKPIEGVDPYTILREVEHAQKKEGMSIPSQYTHRDGLLEELLTIIRPHDVLVTMGAGDITHLAQELMQEVEEELPNKLTVGVLFGGRSSEHEISIISAREVCHHLSEELYDVKQFGMTRSGVWVHGPEVTEFLSVYEEIFQSDLPDESMSPEVLQQLFECDVFIPIFYGPYGEDGVIQGFLEVLGKPYIGCDYRSSSICTDKVYSKQLMHFNGIRTPSFIVFSRPEWEKDAQKLVERAYDELCFPVVVKPVHGGSSIGVTKVECSEPFDEAVAQALEVDTHVIIEEAIAGRELEFAILGNEELLVPPPAEVISDGVVYDFDAKYGEGGIKTVPQADLPKEKIAEGQKIATRVYQVAGCTGFAGVDLFLDDQGRFWFTEINPCPGFTATSLFPRIWREIGVCMESLLDQLIALAYHRKRLADRAFGQQKDPRSRGDES